MQHENRGDSDIGGAVLVVLGAMLWGTTGTAQAFAPQTATPLGIGAARMVFGGAALLVVALIRRSLGTMRNLPLPLTLLSITAMAAYQPFFFAGVARTGVAVGSVVTVGSSPILAGLLAFFFLREVPARIWYLSTALAVAGCILLMLPRGDLSTVDPAGVLLALMAGLSYSTFVLTGKRLSRVCTVDALNAVVFSGAGLLLLPVFLLRPPVWMLEVRGALAALHLGLLATAAAYVLFLRGLTRVPASTGVTLSLAEPLTATILGFVMLGERLEPLGFLGVGLLLLSVVLLSVRPQAGGLSVSYYDYDGWRIRYLETGRGATEGESRHGDADAPVVLLVHGAPGNLDAFKRTLNDPALTARARLISVDRPGYGSSGYGRPETSVSRQAEIIAQVVGAAGGRRPVVVVGHSYGATIAARMAADYPELVGGLVLVSPAVDPNHEVLFFFNSWLEWKPLNRAVPGSIRVANAEKVMHVAELELLKPVLELVTARTIILHGTRDRLVPVGNAGFAHRMLKNAPVELRLYRRMGHLIPFTQNHRVITEAIMDLLS